MCLINARTVKAAAVGKWEYIFSALAGNALSKAVATASGQRRDTHVPCPIHGGKDGFRLFKDWRDSGAGICNTCGCFSDGLSLLSAIRQESFRETLLAVAGVLNITENSGTYKPVVPVCTEAPKPSTEELKNSPERKAAVRLWESGIPFNKENASQVSVLRKYLLNRSLDLTFVPELRFLPCAKTQSGGKIVEFPAMLGAIRDLEGNLVSVHRTFLTQDGKKAPIEVPKKIMHLSEFDSISGCAIRFGKPGRVFALSEGIETALSVVKATGFACWSCVCAGGLKSVRIPDFVKTVLIFEDKDLSQAGQKAANALKKRLTEEGKTVFIAEPPMPLEEGVKSVDFNDVWEVLGRNGFPYVLKR